MRVGMGTGMGRQEWGHRLGAKRWRQGWECWDGGRIEGRDGDTGMRVGIGTRMGRQG